MRQAFPKVLLIVALCALAPRHTAAPAGSFALDLAQAPYFSGSRIPVSAVGVSGPVTVSAVGGGAMVGGMYVAPRVSVPTTISLIGAARGAIALRRLRIVPPPAPKRPLIAVASYQCGIALHDARTFAFLGCAGIGGAPGDVGFLRDGTVFAPQTDGETLVRFERKPWRVSWISGVPEGNEVLVDPRSQSVFVSDRDLNGNGALTRVTRSGSVTHVQTGKTAEGLTLDSMRNEIYVGNVNDATIAQVDVSSMRVLRTLASVPRTFGIALDPKTRRLFAVSNATRSMAAGGGYVAAINVAATPGHFDARSATLPFPLGVALDDSRKEIFVTDESSDEVFVLDPRTLRPLRRPLHSCRTPWRPRVIGSRLYVPCAGAARIDVFDTRTLQRVAGAPFVTGGFPLGVARWP